jgi:hypothetical protein
MSAWRVPLLEQARSDFTAADVLALREGNASQTTMLLQMAWEKPAKAALGGMHLREDFVAIGSNFDAPLLTQSSATLTLQLLVDTLAVGN